MSAREFDRVDDWESRPFEGHEDLRTLAAQEFSGAVRAGGTWLFLLNGRVVGEFGGTVESVADATGTVYTAPHPSVPLLLAMRETGGETRASYYTNETPLSEVDDTLASSGFTGYVELSENVLSGDYYVLYYGGRSMSVAFIGQRGELVTGEEAFDRACDEVGIFEVVATDLDVKDVPGADDAAAAAGAAATGADQSEEDAEAASDPRDTARSDTAPSDTDPAAAAGGSEDDAAPAESAVEEPVPEDTTPEASAADTAPESASADTPPEGAAGAADGESPAAEGDDSPPVEDAPPVEGAESGTTAQPGPEGETAADRPGGEPATEDDPEGDPEAERGDADKFSREEAWRETKTIPALDPEETEPDGDGEPAAGTADGQGDDAGGGEQPAGARSETEATRPAGDEGGPEEPERLRELRSALEERTEELEALRERVDELAEEREDLRAERDRLADRVEELEGDLAAAEERTEGTAATGPALDPERALAETNLFVQYESQGGQATLEDAHADGAEADAVNENLRLEYHTQFEAEGATVGGDPFESFLTGTPEYRFVEWLVRELLYEIRESGHESSLGQLYDAIPEIYRVELRGAVEVPIDEEGGVDTRSFDVVVRDRMGDPLVVADLNDSRDPVTGEMMETLLSAADEAAHAADLAAAFYVTASFFAPASLETATGATSGGLLSRNSLESFVKTGRKTGYHLCLVESRDGSFYLTVPEL